MEKERPLLSRLTGLWKRGPVREVRHAILPIGPGGEVRRASILLRSLDLHWKGDARLETAVVVSDGELGSSRARLPSTSRISVRHFAESEFFRPSSGFFELPGWWKQQIIKLHVPSVLGMENFLTLDADVICVRGFDEHSFVHRGRLISQWERRRAHNWWQGTARTLGLSHQPETRGLSVTPNLLNATVAADVLRAVAADPSVDLGVLRHVTGTDADGQSWTEYALYTLLAEEQGTLERYHVPHGEGPAACLHFKPQIWRSGDEEALFATTPEEWIRKGNGGYFLVVQSTAGIPVERLEKWLQLPGKRP